MRRYRGSSVGVITFWLLPRPACLFQDARYADRGLPSVGRLDHPRTRHRRRHQLDQHDGGRAASGELGLDPWNARDAWPGAQETGAACLASLQVHGRHIATNLEGSPYLRSNHYLADMLGLLTVGSALRADRVGSRWLERARRAFERQIRSQVLETESHFEASVSLPRAGHGDVHPRALAV